MNEFRDPPLFIRGGSYFGGGGGHNFFSVPKGGASFFYTGQQGGPVFFGTCKRGGQKKLKTREHRQAAPPLPVKNDSSLKGISFMIPQKHYQ